MTRNVISVLLEQMRAGLDVAYIDPSGPRLKDAFRAAGAQLQPGEVVVGGSRMQIYRSTGGSIEFLESTARIRGRVLDRVILRGVDWSTTAERTARQAVAGRKGEVIQVAA